MSLSDHMKTLSRWAKRFFPGTQTTQVPMVRLEDLRYIWNYQMVIVPNTVTIDLHEPLVDIELDIQNDLQKSSHLFPFIVGNQGQLVSPKFGRRVTHRGCPQKTSIYLEYVLDSVKDTRLILRIIGKDPQSIHIVKDERRTPELPVTLFMYKPRNHPQENHRACTR